MYPKREGYKTEIVDHLPKEKLRQKYNTKNQEELDLIEDVDYICVRDYAKTIGKKIL